MPTSDSFKVSVDGAVIEVDPSDFDRFEWRELKQLLGMTQMELLNAMAELDLDTLAGMIWLVCRRDDPDVAYEAINLRLSDLYEPPEGDASPPASAGAA